MRSSIVVAVVLCAFVPTAAWAAAPRGEYTGDGVELDVAGRSIQVIVIDFDCRRTTGKTSLTSIPIRRRKGVWRFSIRTFGLVTYRDDHPDENVRVRLTGRFSPTGKVLRGTYRIRSPHCGDSGTVRWTASR